MTLKPCAWRSELAVAIGSPTTLGTDTGVGPFDTLKCTTDPSGCFVPAGGSCAVTSPAGFVDGTWSTAAFRCASLSAPTASVDCFPTREGTSTFGTPEETQILTGSPFEIRLPAIGSCLKTKPAGVFRLAWWFTTGLNPSAVIFVRACASRMSRYIVTGTTLS